METNAEKVVERDLWNSKLNLAMEIVGLRDFDNSEERYKFTEPLLMDHLETENILNFGKVW